MRATDFMSRPVATVAPETPVVEVARLLLERGISAVPVVDAGGLLVGIVSASDLMERPETETVPALPWWERFFKFDQQLAESYARSHGVNAAHVMTRDVEIVGPDAALATVVRRMARRGIHRVVVIEEGRPVGILSRSDVLRAILAAGPAMRASEKDREIRAALVAALHEQPWFRLDDRDVQVFDGYVTFLGRVGTPEEQTALEVAAMNVPGVRGVRDATVAESEIDPLFPWCDTAA